ncbi:hypothetical protein ACFL4N_07350 [Thermodesulfobacteriota bacterium]
MGSCNGCQTCEIACSYHHRGEFIPSVASLKIADTPTAQGYGVELFDERAGQRPACDGCEDLDVPLCVAYCWVGEDLEKILGEYLGKGN